MSMQLPQPTVGDVVQLLAAASAASGLPASDPHVQVRAAELYAAAAGAWPLIQWLAMANNLPRPEDGRQAIRLKRYRAVIKSAAKVRRKGADGQTADKAEVVTEVLRPDKQTGEQVWRTDRALFTDWLTDPIAAECAWRCAALKGHDAVIWKHNQEAKAGTTVQGDDGVETEIGQFRQIIWVEPWGEAAVAALAAAEARRAGQAAHAPAPRSEPQQPPVEAAPATAERPHAVAAGSATGMGLPAAPVSHRHEAVVRWWQGLRGEVRSEVVAFLAARDARPESIGVLGDETLAELERLHDEIEARPRRRPAPVERPATSGPAAAPMSMEGRPVNLAKTLLAGVDGPTKAAASEWAAGEGINLVRASAEQAERLRGWLADRGSGGDGVPTDGVGRAAGNVREARRRLAG